MRSHELGKTLLSMPDCDISASIDIDTEVNGADGEVLIAKLYAHSICEVFHSQGDVTIQFEKSGSGDNEAVDVISVVQEAQKLASSGDFPVGGIFSEHSIRQLVLAENLTSSKVGVKQAGGSFLTLKSGRNVVMSFMLLGGGYKRIF